MESETQTSPFIFANPNSNSEFIWQRYFTANPKFRLKLIRNSCFEMGSRYPIVNGLASRVREMVHTREKTKGRQADRIFMVGTYFIELVALNCLCKRELFRLALFEFLDDIRCKNCRKSKLLDDISMSRCLQNMK